MTLAVNLRSRIPPGYHSPYYKWFVEMGYPQLDIHVEGETPYWKPMAPSGRWHIVEFYRSPVVPSLTPWNYVLRHMENVPITRGFVEKYVKQLDLRRKAVWDAERAKTEAIEREQAALEKHRLDTVNRAHHVIANNPELMERIARNGIHEMDIRRIIKHVPRHRTI